MELRQLRYFCEVARLKSFSQAAARLHVAQSAVSRQVLLLEEDIGAKLFARLGRGVDLTVAGARMLREAEKVLRAVDTLKSTPWALENALSGEVSLGTPPALGHALTAPVMSRLRESHPALYLKADQGTTAGLRDLLLAGRLDVAVISSVERTVGITVAPLAREALYLIGPRDSPMPGGRSINAREIGQYPQIVTPPHNSLRILLERTLVSSKKAPQFVAEATAAELILDLVELHCGYAVLSGSAVQNRLLAHRVRAVRISDLSISWVIATRRDASTAGAIGVLTKALRDVAKEAIDARRWMSAEYLGA